MKPAWIYAIIAVTVLAIGLAIRKLRIIDLRGKLMMAGSYETRSLDEIQYIVLHHSAIDGFGPQDYAQWHVEKNGWPGIGYHFVIQPSGTTYQVNDVQTVSYHVRGHNTPSVGICLSGNLSQHGPTLAQELALRRLIARLRLQLPRRVTVHGHGEFVNTSCPGKLDVEKFR